MTLIDWAGDTEYEIIKTNDPDGSKMVRGLELAIKKLEGKNDND